MRRIIIMVVATLLLALMATLSPGIGSAEPPKGGGCKGLTKATFQQKVKPNEDRFNEVVDLKGAEHGCFPPIKDDDEK